MFAIFLLIVISIVLGSLYVDAAKKNKRLKLDVERLTNSQILLMVPDEQAVDIANWMSSHPQQTQSFVKKAQSEHVSSVVVNDESQTKKVSAQSSAESTKSTEISTKFNNKTVVLSENEDGVKVIHLPHGGIRVTTREQQDPIN
ncbi:membrane anchored protein in chemotaxis locus [Shewanella intestini]|uniref:Membrane anchored protein in chemotaxis locus n=2 Tax=Shewanellaceae TaxID=267890 RepID=A0ABS5HZY2_9GAMM|nr:membrane anchored protein in chemotaxis locus [Shewanella intestini]MBR9727348.1 membrane anchored protein in chemotaxis locus [Shewanella intestini]MRG35602.1 membrane anchored protein in chemotaxis locus [Shewanella sp. XMDDZSB0408]